jgi:hypothetical protein
MKSSPNPTAEIPDRSAPLAADGGVEFEPSIQRDPIDAWMELMEAIEALCPVWPERIVVEGTDFRL